MDLKSFLAGVLLSIAFSCVTPGAPEWHGKIYAGYSEIVGVRRCTEKCDTDFPVYEIISASDEKFNDYFCTSSQDLAELIKIVQSCKKW